jgi:hypothetical protein
MKHRVLSLVIQLSCLFFFGAIPLLYIFPKMASNRILGQMMLLAGLLIATPTTVALLVRLCSRGLRNTETRGPDVTA